MMKVLSILALILLSAWARDNGLPLIAGNQAVSATSLSQMYYLFYPAQNAANAAAAAAAPVILRLQGGPGNSVMLSNFLEIGPASLVGDGVNATNITEAIRNSSWNLDKNVLFIDLLGVGYSFLAQTSDLPTNTKGIVNQLFYVLSQLFGSSGALKSYAGSQFYISGQDFSTRTAAVLAQYILQQKDAGVRSVNLAGVIIGDPFIDPINQITEIGMSGYMLTHFDEVERNAIELQQVQIINSIKNGAWSAAAANYASLQANYLAYSGLPECTNFYTPLDFSTNVDVLNVPLYLQRPDVIVKYNAPSTVQFTLTSAKVQAALANDTLVSYASALVYILNRIPVLVHQSQDDAKFPGPSTQNFLSKLAWKNQASWNNVSFTPWIVNNENCGLFKNLETLSFAFINKAGLFAGYDQGPWFLDMANKWLTNVTNWQTDQATNFTVTARKLQAKSSNVRTK